MSTDEEDLARLHEVEYPGKLNTQSDDTLSDWSMECLNQIKELQQELDQQLLVIQRIEMSILGYTHALQEEIEGKKGH
jgi:hypothetical protein|tara:strand:+ start:560 stop:793 length:234 start_codon:yes stop_codon:yes gene_type:complete